MSDHLERMRAIVAQAVAEAGQRRLSGVRLVVYGRLPDGEIARLFAEASRDTPAEGAAVSAEWAGSRYICWNCCGTRFESADGVCPNCGELALEVPQEIEFALRGIETN